VVVVLGAESKQIEPTLAGLSVHLAVNPAWQEGMGSSLRVGVEAMLERAPGLAALIVALGDQPSLPAQHLDQLIARYQQGRCSLVASHNGQRRMPPVLFGREWFPTLRQLTGDAGAREILKEERPDFAVIRLDDDTDLDTHEDYERYLDQSRENTAK
jgi:molybdenum cofactor cytidylyltransferase